MRLVFILILLVAGFSPLAAQWSGQPGSPVPVTSQVPGQQRKPVAFTEPNGDLLIFWEDSRRGDNTRPELYAQRISAGGEKLFPDSGRKVVGHEGSRRTSVFGIARDNGGNYWIAWSSSTLQAFDSVVINRFNSSTLNPVWSSPKVVFRRGPLFNTLAVGSLHLVASGDSVLVLCNATWLGGTDVKFVNRVDAAGRRKLAGEGFQVPGNFGGPLFVYSDEKGGMILSQRHGNGMGTGLSAWRIGPAADLKWGPNAISESPGLGYDFEAQPDGTGGMVVVYVRTGNDIVATRIDSSGNLAWSPYIRPVCDYSSSQDKPRLVWKNGNGYVVWIDNRPPASFSDVYMQRISGQGERLWNPNGRPVFRLNSYIPVPKIMACPGEEFLVTSLHNIGFVGQRVRADSSLVWPGYGLLIATGEDSPLYEEYTLTPGPGGRAYPVWVGAQSLRLFVAGIDSGGVLSPIRPAAAGGSGKMQIYPNPAGNVLYVSGPEAGWLPHVSDLQGRPYKLPEIPAAIPGQTGLDVSGLPPGMYFLRAGNLGLKFCKSP